MRRAWVDSTVKPSSVRSRGPYGKKKAEVSESQPVSSPTLRVFRIQLQVACTYLNQVPSVLARSAYSPSRPPAAGVQPRATSAALPAGPALSTRSDQRLPESLPV